MEVTIVLKETGITSLQVLIAVVRITGSGVEFAVLLNIFPFEKGNNFSTIYFDPGYRYGGSFIDCQGYIDLAIPSDDTRR